MKRSGPARLEADKLPELHLAIESRKERSVQGPRFDLD
jgi:hypothetical protein